MQDSSIKVFDQLQYKHNIRGGCPYVLVQDRRKGKQTRIQVRDDCFYIILQHKESGSVYYVVQGGSSF